MHERKIPTIIGLLLVGAAVMVFRFAFDRVTPLLSRASGTLIPQKVTVTNISDSSFTVSWLTQESTTGSVVIEGAPSFTAIDERDLLPNQVLHQSQTYITHSVTVRNLSPDTTYRFHIIVNGKPYRNGNTSYEAHTALSISGTGSDLEPAYGQILLPTDTAAEGAIVYLTPQGGQLLSVLVKSSGTWVIPLHLSRLADLSQYLPSQDRIDESIVVRAAQGEASALTDTLNDNPVPVIMIGKTYDFRKIQAGNIQNRNLSRVQTNDPAVLGTNAAVPGTIAITKPFQGAAISSNLPLIQGTGIPGKQVLVLIGIDRPISGITTVSADGIWYYTPPRPLSEGKQGVTITTTDAQDKSVALTHTFQILKSGTQVLGDATPSATLTPTPSIDETPTPSIDETPTPTATLAGEPIPTTGFPLPLIVLLILGFGLLGSGTMVLIK